ncbi:MAG: phenylalanine--tRNA ligase subunit beta [Clostridia bacterium]|nr:phenylalanine--tRNA ligase subunit beta [Clostridia bacterium]
MNVPLSWLKTYVKYPEDLAVADFAEAMIMSGSEVEGYEEMGQDIENVVTGRVVEMKRHEDSDHLWVCMIDVGKENLLQIVTGAQNVTVGAMVPVAMDGAVLPGGKTIKSGALRGVKSEGMLCSGEELNVDAEQFPESAVYGIWILKEDTPIGLDIRTVIGCDEVIVEFKTLANRPDCMCMAGIAREVAATFDTELTLPEISVKETDGNIADYVSVTVEDSDLCPRYCARVVKNIRLAPSPAWMQKALIGAGVRPINNVVDITNYVMLEQGQPMHAFDYSCIRGSHITVRKSAAEDVFTTLDGKEHELSMQPLCICDDEGVIGLAGIMGGLNSEITENTQTVVLESAVFNGAYLRTSARALGMRTEASARFEKGVSIKGAQVALERAAQLFEQLDAGDVVCGVIDVKPEEWTEYTFTASADAVRAHLGMDIPTDTMVEILAKLHFNPVLDGENIHVTVPYWRLDVDGTDDIAEEVLRIYGYDKIPSTLMSGEVECGGRNHRQDVMLRTKRTLCGMGLNEITTFSFISPKWFDHILMEEDSPLRKVLHILNPLGEDVSVMRTVLAPSMLSVLRTNQSRGNADSALFEVSRVFLSKGEAEDDVQPEERLHLCLGLCNRDFFYVKGIVNNLLSSLNINDVKYTAGGASMYHPGRKAQIIAGGKVIGEIGEVHPDAAANFELQGRIMIVELELDTIAEMSLDNRRYVAIARTPAITRDMAVVVAEEVAVGDMLDAIKRSGKGILESVSVFDIYRGEHVEEGYKSIAFSLVYRTPERTLTDDEAKKAFDRAVRSLGAQFGAELRA